MKSITFFIIATGIWVTLSARAQSKPGNCDTVPCPDGEIVTPTQIPTNACKNKRDLDEYTRANAAIMLGALSDKKADKYSAEVAKSRQQRLAQNGACQPSYSTYVVISTSRDLNFVGTPYMQVSPIKDRAKTYWTYPSNFHPASRMTKTALPSSAHR